MNLWRMCEKCGRKAIRANQTPFWRKEGSVIMPLVYADSSVLFAWFHPRDEFSTAVDTAASTGGCGATQTGAMASKRNPENASARAKSLGAP
jgi:hypothetical protein